MFKKIVYYCFAVYFILSLVGGAVLQSRLGQTRHELDAVRMELQLAKDRESDIADSIRRTGEILDSSVNTLSGIRAQIAAIRESYEAMESRLYYTGGNDSYDNSNTNYRED